MRAANWAVGVNGAGTHQTNARESGIVEEAGRIQPGTRIHGERVVSDSRRTGKEPYVLVNRHVFGVDMATRRRSPPFALLIPDGEVFRLS